MLKKLVFFCVNCKLKSVIFSIYINLIICPTATQRSLSLLPKQIEIPPMDSRSTTSSPSLLGHPRSDDVRPVLAWHSNNVARPIPLEVDCLLLTSVIPVIERGIVLRSRLMRSMPRTFHCPLAGFGLLELCVSFFYSPVIFHCWFTCYLPQSPPLLTILPNHPPLRLKPI